MSPPATHPVSITMPLYRWLMLLGALAAMNDPQWFDALADQILDMMQP